MLAPSPPRPTIASILTSPPPPSVTKVAASKRKRVATTVEVNGFTVLRSNNYSMADGISTLSGVRTSSAAKRYHKRQVLSNDKKEIMSSQNEMQDEMIILQDEMIILQDEMMILCLGYT